MTTTILSTLFRHRGIEQRDRNSSRQTCVLFFLTISDNLQTQKEEDKNEQKTESGHRRHSRAF